MENKEAFNGHFADVWALGICLYRLIFDPNHPIFDFAFSKTYAVSGLTYDRVVRKRLLGAEILSKRHGNFTTEQQQHCLPMLDVPRLKATFQLTNEIRRLSLDDLQAVSVLMQQQFPVVDLIQKILVENPSERLTLREIMDHEWLQDC